MLFLDKILLSPIYGTIWVARQVEHAIKQDREAEPERIKRDLSELYMSLDTGRITELEFAAREKELLDQLDRLEPPEADTAEEDAGDNVRSASHEPPATPRRQATK
ncbi:MAG: gas vesicle protein GvpG [Opitutaceae bacterium]|nr:gas vesicle protein GvpG [Opitutaceae bacterium]